MPLNYSLIALIIFSISSAVKAASAPLLPALVPARSIACSILSVVKIPNPTGIENSKLAFNKPELYSPATKSK